MVMSISSLRLTALVCLAMFSGLAACALPQRSLSTVPAQAAEMHELIGTGRIEVLVQGAGIQNVRLRLRRLADEIITVRVPSGTHFLAVNPDVQNMVARSTRYAMLAGPGWEALDVPAAGLNRARAIPWHDDAFSIAGVPVPDEVRRVLLAWTGAHASFAVGQAALWIVTDDADFDALGILNTGPRGTIGTRLIDETAAARALQILAAAGIDAKRRVVWRDISRITKAVRDAGLRAWLEDYARK
jgi:hypothetical protein